MRGWRAAPASRLRTARARKSAQEVKPAKVKKAALGKTRDP